MKKIRVLLADDHPLLRNGTRALIDAQPAYLVCAEAGSAAELTERIATSRADVIVLDLHMPGTDGVALARQLRATHPQIEIVIYSSAPPDGATLEQLLRAGVRSFIRKTAPSELLLAAIKAAGEHAPFITVDVAEVLLRDVFHAPSQPALTERERQIVRLIAEGRASKEIADALRIGTRTAEAHRASVMRKIGATSAADVVRYAIRAGIIEV